MPKKVKKMMLVPAKNRKLQKADDEKNTKINSYELQESDTSEESEKSDDRSDYNSDTDLITDAES